MAIDMYDDVQNKNSGAVGKVHAMYTLDGVDYIDVFCDDRMHYKMIVANWTVVALNDE